MPNKIKVFCGLFCFVFGLFLWLKKPDTKLNIYFCDVGQGDAILIQQGYFQLLIDSGAGERVLTCLQAKMPVADSHIEMILITHFDSDHSGGLAGLLRSYSIGTAWTNSDSISLFEAELQKNQTESVWTFLARHLCQKAKLMCDQHRPTVHSADSEAVIVLSSGVEVQFWTLAEGKFGSVPRPNATTSSRSGEASLGVTQTPLSEATLSDNFSPKNELTSDNNQSVLAYIRYKSVSALFTGDLEYPGELALISLALIPKANLLKVGHHGSKSSTSPEFLRAVSPEIAVISAGKNNRYGHPHPEVIQRLSEWGVAIYRTDELGTVNFVTEGLSWRLSQ